MSNREPIESNLTPEEYRRLEILQEFAGTQGLAITDTVVSQDLIGGSLREQGSLPDKSRLPIEKSIEDKDWGTWENAVKASGTWSAQNSLDESRGNGLWYPNATTEIYSITSGEPIKFTNGYPDFSPWTKEQASILQTGDNKRDFMMANSQLARDKEWFDKDGGPDYKRAEEYIENSGLTWHHHEDQATMQAVPSALHNNVPHIGGASLSREERENQLKEKEATVEQDNPRNIQVETFDRQEIEHDEYDAYSY